MASLNCARVAIIAFIFTTVQAAGAAEFDDTPPALWIRLNEQKQVEVIPLKSPVPPADAASGLIVWSVDGRERWRALPDGVEQAGLASRLGGASRSEGGEASASVAVATVQLDQLAGAGVFRGAKTFVRPPHDGYLLFRRIAIERAPQEQGEEFPADTAILSAGERKLVEIPLAAGVRIVRWDEIKDLPARLKDGLPPGDYRLAMKTGDVASKFTVEDDAMRDWVMDRPDRLRKLLADGNEVLYTQLTVEHLLAQIDENGNPAPYLADALLLIERLPADDRTAALQRLHGQVHARLLGKKTEPPTAGGTGIPGIDKARGQIQRGRWSEALKTLESAASSKDTRTAAFAVLYRAVVLAESGRDTADEADALFRAAIEALAPAEPADLFRARTGYANFLLGRVQDRLHNHAFQIAAGVRNPLLQGLLAWRAAESQYAAALELADQVSPADRASALVNLARAHALLADMIRTLDPPFKVGRRFAVGEAAASNTSAVLAEQALAVKGSDAPTQAAAHEILAHLAFRADEGASALAHANLAEQAYLQAGSLAGVESIRRLRGLVHLYPDRFSDISRGGQSPQAQAERHLIVSHIVSEHLRNQIPADRIGVLRAGFFARRAYVYERIIDLSVRMEKHQQALRFSELAKARALKDILTADRRLRSQATRLTPRDTETMLTEWPAGYAAIEYYLGSRRAYSFVVSPRGEVRSFLLRDASGAPLDPVDLIQRVRKYLDGIGFQGKKMHARISSGAGLDHSWQDDLHRFYRDLIPEEAVATLRDSKHVVIVPHHILHYFPFAALVTERDKQQRGEFEMVTPRFLLDESFVTSYAPSLATWDALRQRPNTPVRRVNAMGIVEFALADPLPGTEKDLQNLRDVFGSRVKKVIDGDAASETALRRLLHEPGLLFIGTHGMNRADRPLSSFLMAHQDDRHNGLLTAREIFADELSADLIVLSACYSGLADRSPQPGDDLFGVQRAFLHSGGRTVVSGLWDVFDETAPTLMRNFFSELDKGLSAPAALAQAQRAYLNELRKKGEFNLWFTHPYFWAVYTAAGDDRTVVAN